MQFILLKIFLLFGGGGVCCFHKLLELIDGKGHCAYKRDISRERNCQWYENSGEVRTS